MVCLHGGVHYNESVNMGFCKYVFNSKLNVTKQNIGISCCNNIVYI